MWLRDRQRQLEAVKTKDLDTIRNAIAGAAPFLTDRTVDIRVSTISGC
jgi:hypothetical protein